MQVRARQAVWEKVEQLLGLELELHVEFTGLISWTAGSGLGWHADDNRQVRDGWRSGGGNGPNWRNHCASY